MKHRVKAECESFPPSLSPSFLPSLPPTLPPSRVMRLKEGGKEGGREGTYLISRQRERHGAATGDSVKKPVEVDSFIREGAVDVLREGWREG